MSRKKNRKRAAASRKTDLKVPRDASFVIRTELTNPIVKAGCAMTVSSVMRVLYFLFGILLGVGAIVYRVFFDGDTLATILVLVLGLMTVWQGNRLPLENARNVIAQLHKQGEENRKRTYYATERGMGVITSSGEVQEIPWAQFTRFAGNQKVAALADARGGTLVIMDMEGFTKGNLQGFLAFIGDHVTERPRNKVQQVCDKMCATLDSWALIQAKYRKEQAEKKAAKQAAKNARRGRGDQVMD